MALSDQRICRKPWRSWKGTCAGAGGMLGAGGSTLFRAGTTHFIGEWITT